LNRLCHYVRVQTATQMPIHQPRNPPTPPEPQTSGWYASSFSHARRVLPDASAATYPANNASVAVWDGRDCMSQWALSARGGGGLE